MTTAKAPNEFLLATALDELKSAVDTWAEKQPLERQALIYRARQSGVSTSQIADILHISEQRAYQLYNKSTETAFPEISPESNERLEEVQRAARALEKANRKVGDAIVRARQAQVPWAALGEIFGVTGQTMVNRYGELVKASDE